MRFGLILSFAIAVTLGTLTTSADAETVLRFAHTQPTSDTHHLAAERFAKLVTERTNGEIKVRSTLSASLVAIPRFSKASGSAPSISPGPAIRSAPGSRRA
jgi:TRAP-type C4-dicarboxylate transport system substrate-binding protein